MHKMTKAAYKKFVDQKSPKSPIFKNSFCAFFFGGTLCCIGQAIRDLYTAFSSLSESEIGMATSITMIFIGALLTGLGVYDNVAKYAGAGTIVPITGFANSIVSPAMEFKSEGWILGVGAKMFTIAGPVIVYGTVASVLCGIICWIIQIA